MLKVVLTSNQKIAFHHHDGITKYESCPQLNKLLLTLHQGPILGTFSRNFANKIKENLIKSFSRSQMTDIEFSDWYFLFLSPTENRTDVGEITGPREKLPSPSSSVSDEVTRSLAEKLGVPISQFRVGSLEQYQVRF